MIRRYLMNAVALVALVLAMTFPTALPAAASPAAHHHIHEAMASLRSAREDLQQASHDFGGHRREAVGAIDRALEQLQICLQYDK
jgi:hypothetical protein